MVRSKDENGRARVLFHLVEQIRAEDKYFNISLSELSRKLADEGQYEVNWEHETVDVDGTTQVTNLRLNLARRGPTWAAALKLHRIRIDGIDWLRRYDDPDGNRCSGWHRHNWNELEQNVSFHIPMPDFAGDRLTISDFLVRMCKEMRISLSASDVGIDDELSWD